MKQVFELYREQERLDEAIAQQQKALRGADCPRSAGRVEFVELVNGDNCLLCGADEEF